MMKGSEIEVGQDYVWEAATLSPQYRVTVLETRVERADQVRSRSGWSWHDVTRRDGVRVRVIGKHPLSEARWWLSNEPQAGEERVVRSREIIGIWDQGSVDAELARNKAAESADIEARAAVAAIGGRFKRRTGDMVTMDLPMSVLRDIAQVLE